MKAELLASSIATSKQACWCSETLDHSGVIGGSVGRRVKTSQPTRCGPSGRQKASRFDSPAKHLEQRFMVLLDLRRHEKANVKLSNSFKVKGERKTGRRVERAWVCSGVSASLRWFGVWKRLVPPLRCPISATSTDAGKPKPSCTLQWKHH